MNFKKLTIILFFNLLLTNPSFAAPKSFTLTADGTPPPDSDLTNIDDGSTILFHGLHDKSYCCEILTKGDGNVDDGTLEFSQAGGENAMTLGVKNRAQSGIYIATGHFPNQEAGRVCFYGDGTKISSSPYQVLIEMHFFNDATVTYAQPRCYETTIYGGFNTFINDYNFLELTNTTSSAIDVWVNATNFDGSSVISRLKVTVPANRRVDVDIHTPAGPSRYGTIEVSHDGPLGALMASLSQYKVVQGVTTLAGQQRLESRIPNR